jgi:hypothetical protein
MEGKETAHSILVRKPEGNRPFEHIDVNRRIILKRIVEIQGVVIRTRFIWFRIETSGRFL